jgi:hypothetical protein
MMLLVTLLAHRLSTASSLSFHTSAWHHKPEATFADALALVRWNLLGNMHWVHPYIPTRLNTYKVADSVVLPTKVFHGFVYILYYPTKMDKAE